MNHYVPSTPMQGAMYHALTAKIAANHSGLGPQNVNTATFMPMTGKAFQKPTSGATTAITTLPGHAYR